MTAPANPFSHHQISTHKNAGNAENAVIAGNDKLRVDPSLVASPLARFEQLPEKDHTKQ
jgi:hypothetical protein